MELNIGKLDKTARGKVLNLVRFGMTMSGKARKGGTWHKKTRQDRTIRGAEQGQAWYDQVRVISQGMNLPGKARQDSAKHCAEQGCAWYD